MQKFRSEHRPKSIEEHLIKKVPIVKEHSTVRSVLSMLEKIENKYDSVDYIYVINKNKNLVGMFYIQELFNNPKDTPVGNFMKKKVMSVPLKTEIEKVAHLALKHNLKQIPVTKSKKLIGVFSSREILSTINWSLRKDLFHFAGVHRSHLDFENSMEIPLFKAIKDRLSWLIVGFVGAMLMALYIGMFEETLAKYLIIASFVPAIVYMSDALGTQVQTIFIRDLAVLGKELSIKKYFLKQMVIGILIASVIGVLMFFSISLFYNVPNIALIISLASFATLIVTSFTALMITLLIKRFKFDPALGSGPIATIISDLTSVVIYFIIVTLLI
ncbi:MAG: magnesium transporter [Nanoarchaeota archaeon]|nr:magnesium transporter [Nanoarchaeota archaeon]